MKQRVLLCSFIFEENRPFLGGFFTSIKNQSENNFDVLLINEGIAIEEYGEVPANWIVVDAAGTPVANRIQSMLYAKNNGYEYMLWQDSDDLCLDRRIESIDFDETDWDIWVHDMMLIDHNGLLLEECFIGDRISYGQIDLEDIRYLNFIGFGNMVVRVSCLPDVFEIPEDIKAVDWWIISVLLANGKKAKYVPVVLSAYRQHDNNMAALDFTTTDALVKALLVLQSHYWAMITHYKNVYADAEMSWHIRRVSCMIEEMANAGNDSDLFHERWRRSGKYLWWEKVNLIVKGEI